MNWPLILTLAAFFLAAGLSFMLGACMASGRADERDQQLIDEIQALRGDPCPWPLRDYAATREFRGGETGGGNPGQLHDPLSSRILSRGSENPS